MYLIVNYPVCYTYNIMIHQLKALSHMQACRRWENKARGAVHMRAK